MSVSARAEAGTMSSCGNARMVRTPSAMRIPQLGSGGRTPRPRKLSPASVAIAPGIPNVAATITAHHLLLNRNALFLGGIRPHHYCLPVLKREEHRVALVDAAVSGNPKFFLGTDSAPHARAAKEAACGCAGIYTAHAAIELYAIAFEEAGALDRLEGFASEFGARFYGLPVNSGRITLVREDWKVPERLAFGGEELVPLRAGESIPWKLV